MIELLSLTEETYFAFRYAPGPRSVEEEWGPREAIHEGDDERGSVSDEDWEAWLAKLAGDKGPSELAFLRRAQVRVATQRSIERRRAPARERMPVNS